METTIRQLGNSDCTIIPKILLKEAGLSRGDLVNIEIDAEKNIKISKLRNRRTLSEIIGDWKAPDNYGLCDFGRPVGKEVW